MRLYSEIGSLVNPNTSYRALCSTGVLLKDIVHWHWSTSDNLIVTVLCSRFTAGIGRQVGHLMILLVLNFPSLLTRGDHSGTVRYAVTEGPSPSQPLRVLPGGIFARGTSANEGTDVLHPVISLRDLTERVDAIVGPMYTPDWVHPHPQVSRMVCLWAGKRRWNTNKKRYKQLLADRAHLKPAARTLAKASARRTAMSHSAAKGLDRLPWGTIRRIVGLNPWGEQILFRIKHHALSVYNPVSAGLGCPHQSCIRAGRVDLLHVFRKCPAALQLRTKFITQWKSAGLSLDSAEEAVFSLTLPAMPSNLTSELGQVIADQDDANIEAIGDSVDKILEGCWRLGAALYLLSVWRWRVSFFHDLNDTTAAHHISGFEARLRAGYAQVTAAFPPTVDARVRKTLIRTIRRALTSPTDGQCRASPMTNMQFIVFCCGDATGTPGRGGGGTMIAAVNLTTGQAAMKYMSGAYLEGRQLTSTMAAHIGLLRGLKYCRQHGWLNVHVAGDNDIVIRHYATRRAPRGKKLQGTYWITRRVADAVAVSSWRSVPREYNATARALAHMARTTQVSMEWTELTTHRDGERWGAIRSKATGDVARWLTDGPEAGSPELATSTV